jgi:hypothetical protein
LAPSKKLKFKRTKKSKEIIKTNEDTGTTSELGSEEGITGADEFHFRGNHVYGCRGQRSVPKYLKEPEVDEKQVVLPPPNYGAVDKDGHVHYAMPRYRFTKGDMDILMQPNAQINSYIIDAASYLIRRTAVNLGK